MTSCMDKLEIDQHGVLDYNTYYQTDEDAEAAIVAVYLQQRGSSYNALIGKNCLTDDFWAAGGQRGDNPAFEQLNEFTFTADQGQLEGMWTSYYQIIYKANVVLGHVDGSETATPVMRRARAEARVFRAMAYFELISMWGTPPVVDHELTASEYQRPNGTPEELWGLVETDLTTAIESGDLAQKKSVDDQSTWRITKQFAQALLGKAYLWQGKNAEAAAEFDAVIGSGLYKLYEGAYEDVLQYSAKMNCESLFETIRVTDIENIFDNWDFTGAMVAFRQGKWVTDDSDPLVSDFIQKYIGNGLQHYGFMMPTSSLYNEFVAEEGVDGYRLQQTMKTYEQLNAIGGRLIAGETIMGENYFFWKWRVMSDAAPSAGYGFCYTNNFRWMRLAEAYLCGAEAHLAAGNTAKATEYINAIRTRAKLASKSSVTLADIQREKRLELCGESTRYQDLQRWGLAYEKMKDQGAVCPVLSSNGQVEWKVFNNDSSKYGFKQGKHELLPIPATEIQLNAAIKQNKGWN